MNPDLDLVLERIIRAPRAAVWEAWTDPARFEKWWVPAPTLCRVSRLDVQPGGAIVTRMSDDGANFVPHLDATFLVVDDLRADRVHQRHRQLLAAGQSRACRHDGRGHHGRSPGRHGVQDRCSSRGSRPPVPGMRRLGFLDGWGTVTKQLAEVVE